MSTKSRSRLLAYWCVHSEMNSRKNTWLFVLPWSLHHAGGVNEVVLNLYRQFAQNEDYRPLVLILDWSATRPVRRVEEGCEVLRFRLRPSPRRWRDIVTWLSFGLRELALLWNVLHSERVTVVNVHYPGISAFPLAVLKAFRLFRGSLVLSAHGQDLTTAREASGWAQVGIRVYFPTCGFDFRVLERPCKYCSKRVSRKRRQSICSP